MFKKLISLIAAVVVFSSSVVAHAGVITPISNTGGGSINPVSNTGGGSINPIGNTGGGSITPVGNTGGGSITPVFNTSGGNGSDEHRDRDNIDDLSLSPSPNWDPTNQYLEISFELESYARDLIVEAVQGSHVIEVYKRNNVREDFFTVKWDGRDEYNMPVNGGVWRIVVSTDVHRESEHIEIEYGVRYSHAPVSPVVVKRPIVRGELLAATRHLEPTILRAPGCNAGYIDTYNVSPEMCEAIAWATTEKIFSGYADGTFRAGQAINRAETMKVVLSAFDAVTILPIDGTTMGFRDVDPFDWYMPYLKTAKFYGMLSGYNGTGLIKPYRNISRVEFLKIALEASDAFTWFDFPKVPAMNLRDVNPYDPNMFWFMNYATTAQQYQLFDSIKSGYLKPTSAVTRGEVAQVLYRMSKNGLLGWN